MLALVFGHPLCGQPVLLLFAFPGLFGQLLLGEAFLFFLFSAGVREGGVFSGGGLGLALAAESGFHGAVFFGGARAQGFGEGPVLLPRLWRALGPGRPGRFFRGRPGGGRGGRSELSLGLEFGLRRRGAGGRTKPAQKQLGQVNAYVVDKERAFRGFHTELHSRAGAGECDVPTAILGRSAEVGGEDGSLGDGAPDRARSPDRLRGQHGQDDAA